MSGTGPQRSRAIRGRGQNGVHYRRHLLLHLQQSGITTGIGAAVSGRPERPTRAAGPERTARWMAEDRIT